MEDIINIQTLATAIVVSMLTSFLSVYLALRKYRTEKWWDKKAECYIETIQSMNYIIRFCDSSLAEEINGKEITDSLRDELDKNFHNGITLLESQTNIGRLLMSDDACNDLLFLDGVLSKEEKDIIKKISDIRVETENCLHSFIPHAKNDLGV